MAMVKTLAKGQIVIPANLRKKYRINPGTQLHIMDQGGLIYLVPPVADPIKEACGLLPSKPSLSEKLLKDRQKDFR